MKKRMCLLLVLSVANIYSVPDEVVSQHVLHKRGNCRKDHRKGYARGAFYCYSQDEDLSDTKLRWHEVMDALRDSTGVCFVLRKYALREAKTRKRHGKSRKSYRGPKKSRGYRVEYRLKKKRLKNNKTAEAELRERIVNYLIDAGFRVENPEMHLNNMDIGTQQGSREKQSKQAERKEQERDKAIRAGMISSPDSSTVYERRDGQRSYFQRLFGLNKKERKQQVEAGSGEFV